MKKIIILAFFVFVMSISACGRKFPQNDVISDVASSAENDFAEVLEDELKGTRGDIGYIDSEELESIKDFSEDLEILRKSKEDEGILANEDVIDDADQASSFEAKKMEPGGEEGNDFIQSSEIMEDSSNTISFPTQEMITNGISEASKVLDKDETSTENKLPDIPIF